MKRKIDKLLRTAQICIMTSVGSAILLTIAFTMIKNWNPFAIFFILGGVTLGIAAFENHTSLWRQAKEIANDSNYKSSS